MTSLYRVSIYSRSQRVPKTTTAPNSWAAVGLWKRFFELQEEEAEEQIAAVVEVLREHERQASPIGTANARALQSQMRSEYYKELVSGVRRFDTQLQSDDMLARWNHERQQLHQPNLGVPNSAGVFAAVAQ